MNKRNYNKTNLAESCQMDLIGSYTMQKQSKLITTAYPSEAVTSFVSLLCRLYFSFEEELRLHAC